jgi:hypothetical protein
LIYSIRISDIPQLIISSVISVVLLSGLIAFLKSTGGMPYWVVCSLIVGIVIVSLVAAHFIWKVVCNAWRENKVRRRDEQQKALNSQLGTDNTTGQAQLSAFQQLSSNPVAQQPDVSLKEANSGSVDNPPKKLPSKWLTWILFTTPIAIFIGCLLIGILVPNKNVGTASQGQTTSTGVEQPKPAAQAPIDISDLFPLKCPEALPADISIILLPEEQLRNVVGTHGEAVYCRKLSVRAAFERKRTASMFSTASGR